ncbi:hypothetical protein NHQ30_001829 [Ciborinia camelliae]|nr:hypothetical protein NHQ30_001829 [Ciborinia camelliae]
MRLCINGAGFSGGNGFGGSPQNGGDGGIASTSEGDGSDECDDVEVGSYELGDSGAGGPESEKKSIRFSEEVRIEFEIQ